MPDAAIYARYSSSLQRPTSIDDQVALCRREAGRFGLTIRHVFHDSEESGAVADRSGYKRLMDAAEKGEIAAVIVEAQDRLWRDQAEMHDALKHLRFWDVKVFAVAAGQDLTGAAGKMIAAVVGIKDEAFLDDLRAKTRRGMTGQVGRKFSAGGRAYGYRSIPVHDETRVNAYGQPVILGYRKVVDLGEAAVVVRIFEMYASGLSPKTIAHRLNAERVPPPRPKRGRKAQGWTWTTISGSAKRGTGILHNEIYRGVLTWNHTIKLRNPDTGKRIQRQRPKDEWVQTPAPDLRIVPDDLWARAKARRREVSIRTDGGRRNRRKHLFSGLLKCGVCGNHYIVRDSTHYVCSFHRNRGPHVCKNERVVRRAVLEERLLQAVADDILSSQNVASLARHVDKALQRKSRDTSSESARRALEAQLRKAEQEAENITLAVRHGKATVTLLEMLEEAEARIQRIRTDLGAPKAKADVKAFPGLVERFAKDLLGAVMSRDIERARFLLARLLGEIVLRPDGEGLVAELRGDLANVLGVGSDGAGRGILHLPTWHRTCRTVA